MKKFLLETHMKLTRTLLSSALLLASTQAFAGAPPSFALGSGVYFYAWNANAHCSTDVSINPSGKCPELWTDTVKNINAQVPASADRAKIKFIYLDSVSLNLPITPPAITKSIFTVGGCADGANSDVVFCSRSGSLTYSDPASESGFQAVSELITALGTGYEIIPMISDQGDASLESLSSGQLESLAYSLACIVNSNATAPSPWPNGFSGGPSSCSDVLTGASLNPQSLNPNISGLAFDIEGPDLSSSKNTDPNSAFDFYSTLQASMGNSSAANSKFIMVSRGPGGLGETQNGTQFGDTLTRLNGNASLATFVFLPQIYDLCDGMGTWACPVTAPFNNSGSNYAGSFLFQPIPSYSAIDGSDWSGEDILFDKLSMSYLFESELAKPIGTSFPTVPVQPSISAGGSTQIWSHVNLYNADFTTSNPTKDPYLTGVPAATGSTSTTLNFQPSMVYGNKQACQGENPDGSLGATISNCVTYQNPYGETLSSYATSLFSMLQYVIGPAQGNNSSSVFSGVSLYPFTPYGFWDETCGKKSNICMGFFPEIPNGLINGQKPQISFWDTYINQFANQWTGSSTGTIPTQDSAASPTLFLTLPTGYYNLSAGTATVNFGIATYPMGGNTSGINSYRANLIDAVGNTVASGTCASSTCTQIQITNAPGGNYILEVQALDINNGVIASVEGAAEAPGAPVPPIQVSISIQSATYVSPTSYTLTWTLNCTMPPAAGPSIATVSGTFNGKPNQNLSTISGGGACGKTQTTSYSIPVKGYSVSPGDSVSLVQTGPNFQAVSSAASTTLSEVSPQ